MSSETTMVAEQCRFQEWAAQIWDCQGRPVGMSVVKWCACHGMESLTLSAPYMVRVSISDLNIRRGPGTSYPKTGKFTGVGIFTIVEESDGWGLLKAYEEKRDGWISLSFTTRM